MRHSVHPSILSALWSILSHSDAPDVERMTDRVDIQALLSETPSGIPVDASYGPRDSESSNPEPPGEFPFGRGIRADGYRSGLWVMGQYSGLATPRETNARMRSLLASGQRGFSIALDLPTQNGIDADDPLAEGEVGKVGVPISSLSDMEELLVGIPMDQLSQIRTTANSIGPIAVALFVAAAKSHGFRPDQFKVLLQNDVLKEYLARGTQIFPPRYGLAFSVDVIEYCTRHLPHWEPIEFCGYHVRDAGADAVQEAAIAAANGFEYIDAALARGLQIDDFAHRLFMFLCADIDIFEEVAKFRAIRRVWARSMERRFGAQLPESKALNLFVYTLGGSLTAQEPLNNIARVGFQALAAVLGGVQTLATSSYDEAIRTPTADAARISLRAQQILAFEAGVARTADPLGGSYYVEYLTSEMEQRIERYLQQIADQGGALAALETGWLHNEVEAQAYRQHRDIERRRKLRVGVNVFADDDSGRVGLETTPTRTDVESEQVDRLQRLRSTRDNGAVEEALERVRQAARAGRNTVPPIIEAIERYATVGEIVRTLKMEWGSAV